jgi:AcrR family transcriptional regulator
VTGTKPLQVQSVSRWTTGAIKLYGALDMATHPTIKDEVTALKRERTIGAAAQLFYDRGYENTTLEAVAETLGVTKPFIYGHFKSKAELLADICTRGVSASLVAIDTAVELEASPSEKLRRFARDFLIAVLNNQQNIAILTREEKISSQRTLSG